MLRHQDQGNLQKREFIWGFHEHRVRIYEHHGREHGVKLAGMQQDQLRAHIFICRLEAENTNWTGMGF